MNATRSAYPRAHSVIKMRYVVLYALLTGFLWGSWFTRPVAVASGPLPANCYTVGKYSADTYPARFCAPPEVETQ